MPAIQPAQLKIQAAELAQKSSHPEVFCKALHSFFEKYSDRTYRPGKIGQPQPLIRSYHVPQPVINGILRELVFLAQNDREAALTLIDTLWSEPYFEFRVLAASLLGQVIPRPTKSIMGRIQSWVKPKTDQRLVDVIINYGLERMRREQSDSYIQQIKLWLISVNVYEQRMGIKAISPLVADLEFEDFPMVYDLISPIIQNYSTQLRPDIMNVVEVLISRSSKETAYFLHQLVKTSKNDPNIAWIVRHSIEFFPQETQDILRGELKKTN
jgi:hypothetical protein